MLVHYYTVILYFQVYMLFITLHMYGIRWGDEDEYIRG